MSFVTRHPCAVFLPLSRPGMINVRHPRCADPACKRQPSFGVPVEGPGKGKAVFCVEHRDPGMVDVKNNYRRKLKRKEAD